MTRNGAGRPTGNGVAALLGQRPRARRTLVLVAIVAAVAATAAWWYYSGRESTDDAQVDGHIVPIAARVGGSVEGVKVEDNERVTAGTVLVVVDPRDYRVALQKAEADYAAAEAAVAAAQAGIPITSTTTASQVSAARANVGRAEAAVAAASRDVEAARARLDVARARLVEARANATRVDRDLERMEQLVVKDEVSRQQYDAAVAAAASAKAAVQSAEATIVEATEAIAVAESRRVQAQAAATAAQADLRTAETAPHQVTVTRARADSADAQLAQAGAALAQARLNLTYTTIAAPSDGTVSKKNVEPGQIIQPGQPLMALVPLADIWITANFKETQLRDMRVGQPARVKVDAYGRVYRGHVESIAAATGARFSLLPPENATGNFVKVVQRVPVRIALEADQDPTRLLRPGMSVVATVLTR